MAGTVGDHDPRQLAPNTGEQRARMNERTAALNASADPRTPAERLHELSTHEVTLVRIQVGRHAGTPASTLMAMAKDPVPFVRAEVAGNENTPAEVLVDLAAERPDEIRIKAAGNPTTPVATRLQLLHQDRVPTVQASAARSLSDAHLDQVLRETFSAQSAEVALRELARRGVDITSYLNVGNFAIDAAWPTLITDALNQGPQ